MDAPPLARAHGPSASTSAARRSPPARSSSAAERSASGARRRPGPSAARRRCSPTSRRWPRPSPGSCDATDACPSRVGIGVPELVDAEGRIRSAHLLDWSAIPLAERLAGDRAGGHRVRRARRGAGGGRHRRGPRVRALRLRQHRHRDQLDRRAGRRAARGRPRRGAGPVVRLAGRALPRVQQLDRVRPGRLCLRSGAGAALRRGHRARRRGRRNGHRRRQ